MLTNSSLQYPQPETTQLKIKSATTSTACDPDNMDGNTSSEPHSCKSRHHQLQYTNNEDHLNSLKHYWTQEEDDQLKQLVKECGAKNWKKIASYFEYRTDVQCLHRWQKVLNPILIKGPWTEEEDELLAKMVKKLGPRHWSIIASALSGRIGKQCRERYQIIQMA